MLVIARSALTYSRAVLFERQVRLTSAKRDRVIAPRIETASRAVPSLDRCSSCERLGDRHPLLLATTDSSDHVVSNLCAEDAIETEDGGQNVSEGAAVVGSAFAFESLGASWCAAVNSEAVRSELLAREAGREPHSRVRCTLRVAKC